MNMQTAAPTAPLPPLIAEADAVDPTTRSSVAGHRSTAEDGARRVRRGQEHKAPSGTPLLAARETGQLLYVLARNARATSVLEFGTSFGLSTFYLAAALRDNGGGRIITTELAPSKLARARANLGSGGLAHLVEFREGDALETLNRDLPESIDVLLLGGAPSLYSDILDRVESRLRSGALIVADNADFSPDYATRVRDPERGYLSIPFAADVELSIKFC